MSESKILSLKTNPSLQIQYKHNPNQCSWLDSWAINASITNGGGMGKQTSDGCVAFDESFNSSTSIEMLLAVLRMKLYELYAKQYETQFQVEAPSFGVHDFLFVKSTDYQTMSQNTKWMLGGGFRLKKLPSLSIYVGLCHNSVILQGSVSPSFQFYNPESNSTYTLEEYEQKFVDFYDTLISIAPDDYQILTYYNYHKNMKDYFSCDTVFNHYNDGGRWNFNYQNIILGFDYLTDRFNIASKFEFGLQGYHRVCFGVKYYSNHHTEMSFGFDCYINPYNKVYSTVEYSPSKTTSQSIEWNLGLSYKYWFNDRFSNIISAGYGQNDILLLCGVNNVPVQMGEGEVTYRNVNFTDFKIPIFKIGTCLSYNFTNNFSMLFGLNCRWVCSDIINPNKITMSSAKYYPNSIPEINISLGIVGHIF